MFDTDTLFAANAIILAVMALALRMAGLRNGEPYWTSWAWANMVLALALIVFMAPHRMPPAVAAFLPNFLLVLGIGLRLLAARQFTRGSARAALYLTPCLAFIVLCAYPLAAGMHGAVFTLTNVILTALSVACAVEFARPSHEPLPSRYGLAVAYGAMSASFGVRIFQGLYAGGTMETALPIDLMLELHLLVALFHTVASGAFALSIAYERKAFHLEEAARRDALTGLLNRGAFESTARSLAATAGGAPVACVLFDIDHFKSINDLHGHAAGDRALKACARVFTRRMPEGGVIGRVGGEEFALFVTHMDAGALRRRVQRICDDIRGILLMQAGRPIALTVSAGIAEAPAATADFERLMQAADVQLYRAKHNGRDRVERAA